MPRGVPKNKKAVEAFVKFLKPDLVPEEMKPTGKNAANKGLPVVVLSKNSRTVELQYTPTKRGKASQVLRCVATFPIDAVVLYHVEAVDIEAVDAPKVVTKVPTEKRVKKASASAKKPTKKKAVGAVKNTAITKAIRANKASMSMGDLSDVTKHDAASLRKALTELIEEGVVVREGKGRGTTYGLVRRKKVVVKKKGIKKKKVVRRKKKTVEEDAPKKRRKKKKGKKPRKFGSSSRRKTSFNLDDDD